MMTHTKHKVITQFNKELGRDIKNLAKCLELLKMYEEETKALKKDLSLANSEVSSKVTSAVESVENVIEEITEVVKRHDALSKNITELLNETGSFRNQSEDYLEQIETLECAQHYVIIIEEINNLSSELQQVVNAKDDEKSVTVYANLCEISRSLVNSPAVHLKNFLRDVIHYWHNILKEKFGKEFEDVLKSVRWPFINTNVNIHPPSSQSIDKLQLLTEYLLQVQLPEESTKPLITSALLSDFPPLSLPVMFMVRPLRKRFLYHFYGARQTNRIDKPEWYFTQILTWIRDHRDFVVKWIQPVVDKLAVHDIDVKVELMRGLVQLVVEKLHADIPNIQYDDFIFSHCVDEALGFDQELRDSYEYPDNQPSILAVLTQASVFVKWLTMEKKFATEKMDTMLSSPDAFEPLALDVDEFKITTAADTFITLLQTIQERYENLPQPGHRLQFLDLQLELLDDFRVRLLQLSHMENEELTERKIPQIANTAAYIQNVLMDWGNSVHYLHLYYYKNKLGNIDITDDENLNVPESPDSDLEGGTVFDDILSLYKHMKTDLVLTICESVVLDVKAKSRAYRRNNWSTIPFYKDTRSLSLSPSACEMFEILIARLLQLQQCLSNELFKTAWRNIAEQLDQYFFEELIMQNHFNEGGAEQLKYDISRNLFPLFAQYTEKPETYFRRLQESCQLLTLAKGTILLLKDRLISLDGAEGIEDSRRVTLTEIGVHSFTPQVVLSLVNLRIDLSLVD